jgi:hypothetical protein
MNDFNIAKYLKEHNLGAHGILGNYIDLQALKEASDDDLWKGAKMDNQKVPYEGPDTKLDGDSLEFDQVDPVCELEKPDQIYTNDWMNDSIDGKKVGNWTCYFEDFQNLIYWINDYINSEDAVVYATPGWDNVNGIACETSIEHGEASIDHETIGDSSYPDFESYAQDVKPYLDKVEQKYLGESEVAEGIDDIDVNEYDQLVGAIESLLQQGESEADILQVVKDTLGLR